MGVPELGCRAAVGHLCPLWVWAPRHARAEPMSGDTRKTALMDDWFDLYLIVALTVAGIAGVTVFLVVLLVLLLPLGTGMLVVESWCWVRRRWRRWRRR